MIKPYLIEIRMMGPPKHMARDLIYDIHKKFRVRGAVKHRPVPHMSLFGPFGCKSLRDVIHTIGEVGSEFSELPYDIDGFDYFEIKKKFLFITTSSRKNVIYLKIKPSDELKEFRHKLAKKLLITLLKKENQEGLLLPALYSSYQTRLSQEMYY